MTERMCNIRLAVFTAEPGDWICVKELIEYSRDARQRSG